MAILEVYIIVVKLLTETLNTYATDGLKWWFSNKDQEGFNPDNHEFWLMGNGDKDD